MVDLDKNFFFFFLSIRRWKLPPGRKPIKTVHRYDSNRLKVFQLFEKTIKKGAKYTWYIFIPRIGSLDYKDLMDGMEYCRDFFLCQISQLYRTGQMKPVDKECWNARFCKGETQIMWLLPHWSGGSMFRCISMINWECWTLGLSQLHQIAKGRVGRGSRSEFMHSVMSSHKLSTEAKNKN